MQLLLCQQCFKATKIHEMAKQGRDKASYIGSNQMPYGRNICHAPCGHYPSDHQHLLSSLLNGRKVTVKGSKGQQQAVCKQAKGQQEHA